MPNGGMIFAIMYPLLFIAIIALVVYAIVKKDVKAPSLATSLHLLGIFTAFVGFIYFAVEVDLSKLVKVGVLFLISAIGILYGYRMSKR